MFRIQLSWDQGSCGFLVTLFAWTWTRPALIIVEMLKISILFCIDMVFEVIALLQDKGIANKQTECLLVRIIDV